MLYNLAPSLDITTLTLNNDYLGSFKRHSLHSLASISYIYHILSTITLFSSSFSMLGTSTKHGGTEHLTSPKPISFSLKIPFLTLHKSRNILSHFTITFPTLSKKQKDESTLWGSNSEALIERPSRKRTSANNLISAPYKTS